MMSSTMPSAKYSCSGSPLMFWNGSTAIDGLSGSGERGLGRCRRLPDPGRDAIDADRPGDVLELLLAHVLEGQIELVAHLIAHTSSEMQIPPGSASLRAAPRYSRHRQRCRRSSMMMSPTIDADAKLDALSAGTPALRSAMPRCISTAQRTASTTLANSTRMPSPVVLTMRPRCSAIFGSTSSRRRAFKRSERAFLVGAHQTAVASDISREDGRQPPFHALVGHGAPQVRLGFGMIGPISA